MDARDIILRPLISEKAVAVLDDGKYTFKVRMDANKMQIADSIEKIYNVTVVSVHTMRMHGKMRKVGKFQGRRSDWKKAIIELKDGDSIKVLEGL